MYKKDNGYFADIKLEILVSIESVVSNIYYTIKLSLYSLSSSYTTSFVAAALLAAEILQMFKFLFISV